MNILVMKTVLLIAALLSSSLAFSQKAYKDSIKTYLKNYVQKHGVVQGKDKQNMTFFEVNPAYRVVAEFTPSSSSNWIRFKTSGKQEQVFRVYGTASFLLKGKIYRLNVYQSQDLVSNPRYKNYLFLPFTDATSGKETYSGGRYIDLTTEDIANKKVVIDFNKAYNPYCAYVSGVYTCPIPPKENALTVAIRAGEKAFTAAH